VLFHASNAQQLHSKCTANAKLTYELVQGATTHANCQLKKAVPTAVSDYFPPTHLPASHVWICAAAPYVNKPEYVLAQQYANDIADLLAPQSGAYYDVWLDGEKFVSVYKEVRGQGRWCWRLC
jgi:hypothetical protein